jgi:hypothetical protein
MDLACSIDWKAVAKILEAVTWPLVAAAALWSLRTPLRRLLDRVAEGATKLSLGSYSVELRELREVTPSWQAMNLDVRKLTSSQVFDSGSQSLFEQLTQRDQADYAVIDLGVGNQWLSSRLFIFAVVLGRVRGIQALVFLATRGDVSRHFIGTAEPEGVHLALARRYPWLEAAFAAANQPYDPRQGGDQFGLLAQQPIQTWTIQQVVRSYIEQVQTSAAPIDDTEWQPLGTPPQAWERTAWLSSRDIEEILGASMLRGYAVASPERTKSETTASVLRSRGKFVALVDEERRLIDLIDRAALSDKLAADSASERTVVEATS